MATTSDPTKPPRRNGPPRKDGPGLVVGVRIQRPLLAKIDTFAASQGGRLSRPAVIRQIVERAIGERKP
jgi:hypothetical protein